MTDRFWWTWILVTGLAIGCYPTPSLAQQKEKVYRRITTPQVETILNALDIDYRKNKDKKQANTYFYEYGAKYKIVLGFHNGTHLWLTANFPKTAPETINKWNVDAKFSRAVLFNLNNKETATVESQLDCAGGVTEGMIRQFLLRFDAEVENFDQLLKKSKS